MLVRASRILLLLAPLSVVSPTRATAADAGMMKAPAAPPATAAAAVPPPAAPKSAAKTPNTAKANAKTPKKAKAPKNPPVVLYTVNHKETFSLRLRDAQG